MSTSTSRRGFIRRCVGLACGVAAAPAVVNLIAAEAPKFVIATPPTVLPVAATSYRFADPVFIGKNYIVTDMTMYVKRESYNLEFFDYESQQTHGLEPSSIPRRLSRIASKCRNEIARAVRRAG